MPSACDSSAVRDAKSLRLHAMQRAEVANVLPRGQIVVQPGGVRQHAQVRARLRSLAADVDAVDARFAAVGRQHAVEHAQTGGFAGAIGAEQTGDLAVARHERDVARRFDAAEAFVQAHGLDHGAGPVMLRKNGSGVCRSRQLASSLSGAALSRKSAATIGMQPVVSWPWPSPFKIKCRWRVSPLRGALGIDRRGDRIRLAGQQQRRNIAVQGSVQVGVHRSLRPEPANLLQRIHHVRALVGFRHGGAIDLPREKRFILAADHAVLHAVRQLIGDLPHIHHRLGRQRPQLAVRRLVNQRRQAAKLAGCCRKASAARR